MVKRMSASTRFDNGLRYLDGNDQRQWQFTPAYVLDLVRADLGGSIGLDPCTTADNPTCAARYYTADDDGLSLPWDAASIYVNPPYGKAREPWVRRCIEEGATSEVILLMPAATDTRIFQRAAESAHALVFIRGRVKFGTLRANRRQHAASHPSALFGWNTALEACASLGWRVAA